MFHNNYAANYGQLATAVAYFKHLLQVDSSEVWLQDDIDDTFYFPDENGQFNLQQEALSTSCVTLIVDPRSREP